MKHRMNIALATAILESRRTQKRTAELAGLSAFNLNRIVNGYRAAAPKERARLAKVLAISEAALFPELVTK